MNKPVVAPFILLGNRLSEFFSLTPSNEWMNSRCRTYLNIRVSRLNNAKPIKFYDYTQRSHLTLACLPIDVADKILMSTDKFSYIVKNGRFCRTLERLAAFQGFLPSTKMNDEKQISLEKCR